MLDYHPLKLPQPGPQHLFAACVKGTCCRFTLRLLFESTIKGCKLVPSLPPTSNALGGTGSPVVELLSRLGVLVEGEVKPPTAAAPAIQFVTLNRSWLQPPGFGICQARSFPILLSVVLLSQVRVVRL